MDNSLLISSGSCSELSCFRSQAGIARHDFFCRRHRPSYICPGMMWNAGQESSTCFPARLQNRKFLGIFAQWSLPCKSHVLRPAQSRDGRIIGLQTHSATLLSGSRNAMSSMTICATEASLQQPLNSAPQNQLELEPATVNAGAQDEGCATYILQLAVSADTLPDTVDGHSPSSAQRQAPPAMGLALDGSRQVEDGSGPQPGRAIFQRLRLESQRGRPRPAGKKAPPVPWGLGSARREPGRPDLPNARFERGQAPSRLPGAPCGRHAGGSATRAGSPNAWGGRVTRLGR